jgi:hypothetical protein
MTISVCVSRISGCCDDDLSDTESEALGCVVGDEIVDSLITSDLAAESVGRAYIDEEMYDMEDVTASCSLHGYMQPGWVAKATDRVDGAYNGEIDTFSINISKDDSGATITAYSAVKIRRLEIV